MHLAFIDDSQQRKTKRGDLGALWALGAVIIPEQSLRPYADDLVQIKNDLGIPVDEEVKWRPPNGSFLDLNRNLQGELRVKMLEAAVDRGIRAAVVMVDRGSAYADLSDGEVGKRLLEWLYERISMHLQGENCVAIADKVGGGSAEEKRWLAETLELTNDGTEYVKPRQIVLPIVTAPSHHLPHLQLADLVTASCTAAVAGYPKGTALVDLLTPLLIRNLPGDAGGAGIKIHPFRLRNLYLRVFNESRMSRWNEYDQAWEFESLPVQGLPFEFDGGLHDG